MYCVEEPWEFDFEALGTDVLQAVIERLSDVATTSNM